MWEGWAKRRASPFLREAPGSRLPHSGAGDSGCTCLGWRYGERCRKDRSSAFGAGMALGASKLLYPVQQRFPLSPRGAKRNYSDYSAQHFQTKPNVNLNIQIIEKECGFGAGRQGALEVLETLLQRSMRSDGC